MSVNRAAESQTAPLQTSPPHPLVSVDSLPAELVAEILNLVTYETDWTRLHSPVLLSHVSSRWRDIAIGTSSLWTSIVLNFPCPRGEIRRLRVGLTRSHRQPLDIRIDLRDEDWDWLDNAHEMQADEMFRIFDIISSNADRWRTVEILTDNWQPIHAFLALSTKLRSLPILERLDLSRCNAYYGIFGAEFQPLELRQPIELFGGNASLPNLRWVTLAGVHIDWACSGLKDLSELELRYIASDVVPSTDEFARIIRDSPNLEALSLIGCVPSPSIPSAPGGSPQTHLYIPTLKRFGFGWSHVQKGLEILSVFQLAGIEELHLEDVMSSLYNIDAQDSSPVLEHLVSLNCSTTGSSAPGVSQACYSLSRLRRFSMEALHASSAALCQLLECMENVEEIEVRGVDADLIRIFGLGGSPLCPKLKKLKVGFSERCGDAMSDTLASVRAARGMLSIEATEFREHQ